MKTVMLFLTGSPRLFLPGTLYLLFYAESDKITDANKGNCDHNSL